jgi:hypothetical protein
MITVILFLVGMLSGVVLKRQHDIKVGLRK